MKYKILLVVRSIQIYWNFSTQNLTAQSRWLELKRLRTLKDIDNNFETTVQSSFLVRQFRFSVNIWKISTYSASLKIFNIFYPSIPTYKTMITILNSSTSTKNKI